MKVYLYLIYYITLIDFYYKVRRDSFFLCLFFPARTI
nr:MAG TPA: hypothetical protein [Caudoviricetes sp.]